MTTYQLAGTSFSIDGRGPVVDALREEFAPVAAEATPEADIAFRFVERLPDMGRYVSIPPVKAGEGVYELDRGGIVYQVRRSDAGGWDVALSAADNAGERAKLLTQWRRFKDWNYLSRAETTAKNFVYGIFDYLSQVAHLDKQASYLHASSFEKDGRGVAIVAWGGIGKTTSLLKLATEDGWRFLSDDLGLIDRDGRLWRTPKKMQIYAYNIEGQPQLGQRLLGGRSPVDRASWIWRRVRKGAKGVRRRVSAEEFFGPANVGSSAPLEELLFIERANVADFECESMSVEQIAAQAAVILLDELEPFVEIATALHSGEFEPVLPRPDEFYSRSRAVIEEAFAGQSPRLVRIPSAAGPDALADYLRSLLD